MTDPAPTGEPRFVTQDDINLVVDAMVRREVAWLRPIGWGVEMVGWGSAGRPAWWNQTRTGG